MILALPEQAALAVNAEDLWRGSCVVAAQGNTEHAEWLHEMAVDLLDIQALPEPQPVDAVEYLHHTIAEQLGRAPSDEFDLF